jgi:Diacylglycerol kinase accessory domain
MYIRKGFPAAGGCCKPAPPKLNNFVELKVLYQGETEFQVGRICRPWYRVLKSIMRLYRMQQGPVTPPIAAHQSRNGALCSRANARLSHAHYAHPSTHAQTIPLRKGLRGIIVLNLQSYGGGRDLWGTSEK